MVEKQIYSTPKAPAAIGPYSQAVEAQGWLFCSGQIPIDPSNQLVCTGSISEQAELVLNNIGAVLGAAGLDYINVVKATTFLTNLADFTTVNEIYGRYFKTNPPARSTIQVAALPKGVQVEIEVIASRV